MRRWVRFCDSGEISVLAPSIGQILHFLWDLYGEGLGYSAINTARSALSALIDIDGQPAGQHRLVRRFVKATFQSRPALPHNNVVWDAELVLTYLKNLPPVKYLSMKQLTQKLSVLLLLLSGQRHQTIHLLDIRNMTITAGSVKFRIGDLVKQSRPGTHVNEIVFKGYAPNRKLCIRTVLMAYLKRTLNVQGGEKRLLLTYGRPIHAASKATIRRWTLEVLAESGVDLTIFTPHSTRSAATSKASKHVPLDTILKTAGWSRESTFRQYYDKPIDKSGTFGNAVLARTKKHARK